jgi:hypothetical protein
MLNSADKYFSTDTLYLYYRNGIFAGVELEYDRFSRLTSWKWGDLTESYGFDRAGRLSEIRYGDGSAMIYAFKDMFSSLVSNYKII